MTMQRFASEADVVAIGRGMTGRTLPRAEWTHAAHFAAAVWLIRTLPPGAPERDMPEMIRAYNLSVGGENTDTAGYHETITQASLAVVRKVLAGLAPATPLHEATHAVLEAGYANKDWLLAHWRRETLFSVTARREWVAPDLAPLPSSVADGR